MGLFKRKRQQRPTSTDAGDDAQQEFLDEYFREELRNRGRWYFENIIKKNADLFKQDLDQTIAEVQTELKEHISTQLQTVVSQVSTQMKEQATQQMSAQLNEYTAALGKMQQAALDSLARGERLLQQQQQQFSQTTQAHANEQEAAFRELFEESKSRFATVSDTQERVLQQLNTSARSLTDQQQRLAQTLQENVTKQETLLMGALEVNMARVIEHYLLGAVSEQYDLKAQLPSIVKQMETNKQAMMDDMRL